MSTKAHIILSVLTMGLWIPCWILIALLTQPVKPSAQQFVRSKFVSTCKKCKGVVPTNARIYFDVEVNGWVHAEHSEVFYN